MPCQELLLGTAALEVAARVLGARDPVARIGGVGVTAVAVVCDERVADEVVARDDPARDVGVRPVAGVDDADPDRLRIREEIPGGEEIDAVEAAGRCEHVPLLRPTRVVRRRRERHHHLVGLGRGHVSTSSEAGADRIRVRKGMALAELEDERAVRELAQLLQVDAGRRGERARVEGRSGGETDDELIGRRLRIRALARLSTRERGGSEKERARERREQHDKTTSGHVFLPRAARDDSGQIVVIRGPGHNPSKG